MRSAPRVIGRLEEVLAPVGSVDQASGQVQSWIAAEVPEGAALPAIGDTATVSESVAIVRSVPVRRAGSATMFAATDGLATDPASLPISAQTSHSATP